VYHFSPLCNLTRQSVVGLVYGDGKMLPPPFLSECGAGERRSAVVEGARPGETAGARGGLRTTVAGSTLSV